MSESAAFEVGPLKRASSMPFYALLYGSSLFNDTDSSLRNGNFDKNQVASVMCRGPCLSLAVFCGGNIELEPVK